jgi:membrane protein YdbS with pleckstrin-like domain
MVVEIRTYNNEQIKQEIGILKIFLGFSIAVFISIIAWLFQNFNSISLVKSIISIIALSFILLAIDYCFQRIRKFISQLGDKNE